MSDDITAIARRTLLQERESALGRMQEISRLIGELEVVQAALEEERCRIARRVHALEETLDLSPQLPISALEASELRGRRLREVAVEVLRDHGSEPIHYRDLLRLLERRGVRVGGRDPGATLLTQISRCDDVVSVRSRSGLYRLRNAA